MLYFNCDYTEGAHPHILEKMQETNLEQTIGYGEDEYCEQARALIRRECGRYDVDVHFLVGGTQANFTVIRASLRSHQGVIAPVTGHINGHETGAVEATGHKVLAQACGPEGKLTADQVEQAVTAHWTDEAREHLVQPKMVYISHPTENGALYTLAELEALSHTCREHGLYLFLDGARLGYGLTARGSDVSMADLARLCDAFYIGGTKNGMLMGEAVVVLNSELKAGYRHIMKQRGGMLAKGWLLGLQFETLLQDGLYFELARHANAMAQKLAAAFAAAGCGFVAPSPTNQIFPILPLAAVKKLAARYGFELWGAPQGDTQATRFVCSWATREEDVDALIADLKAALA